ncbi:conserved hypothetical protein [Flavobacterium psychrophilum]|uniref:DDE-type integrase/transposase/recombinase n=1 Tax=Flavobacterium psychrophilum TaxID=96345 RepID=UPI000B7C5329|nr:DDE-type integrase/transposase/recombinase [Flavobacterium psychrophilum]SNA83194.1 conserved hypothetical protein [Flavobacterium psychrophilum]
MNFKHTDIIIRKETKQEVWISERLVIEVCDISKEYAWKIRSQYKTSVSKSYHRFNILPVTGKSWRWAKINGLYYYDFDFIPNKKPTFYKEMFGDKTDLIDRFNSYSKNQDNSILEIQFKAFLKQTYNDYLHCYIDYRNEHRTALAKACAVIEFCVQYIENNPNLKGNTIYKEMVAQIEKHDLGYLPKNYRIFKQKIDAVINGGQAIAEVIHLPREGNNNALLHDDPQIMSWAIQLRAMPENYSNEHITRLIQDSCLLQNKKVPSRRWFGQNVYEQHEVKFLTASKRFGTGSRKSFVNESYIPMEGALFSGDCWQIDATRLNIIAHKRVEVSDDGTKTTSDAFLFVIAVRDVHSGDVLGYSFDYSENRWSVHNALKMAVETAGYLPYELAFDRFPGHNTTEWELLFERLQTMGVKLTKTHKATAKAGVERFFGTLQDVFMQHDKYYYGQGIQSKRLSAHRSPEYLAKIKKEAKASGFDVIEAMNTGENIIENYRETALSYYSRKHSKINKSPRVIHAESEKPHVRWVENYEISMLLALKKEITIKHNGMILTEFHKTEYIYQVEDYEVYSKIDKVIISYDLNDLSNVYLFKPNGNLLIHLGEANLFNKPVQYGPQAEHNKIATEKARIKEINERKEAELAEKIAIADEVPMLMGRFTNKSDAENNETLVLLEQFEAQKTNKKAVGSTYNTNNDFDLTLIKTNY